MSGEKTEEPTEQKLENARKKGQVAQSQDINKLFVTLAGFELIIALKDSFMEKIQVMMLLPLARINDPFLFSAKEIAERVFTMGLIMSLTIIAAVVVARMLASWIQFGFLMAPETLAPSLNKLDPVSNIKNLFSIKKIIELLSNIAKAAVLAFVFYSVIMKAMPDILLMSTGTLTLSINASSDIFIFAARLSLIFFGIIAIGDFIVQKHFFIKGQKMSKDEIFREYKQSEGDPQTKGERKALGRELIESGPAPVAKVDEATAVVVNPTHFAIALRYIPGETPLPKMLCKGVDERAQEIIARARENGIPVVRYIWLARTLFSTGKENAYIPRAVIKPMAAVFRAIKEMEDADSDYDADYTPVINHED